MTAVVNLHGERALMVDFDRQRRILVAHLEDLRDFAAARLKEALAGELTATTSGGDVTPDLVEQLRREIERADDLIARLKPGE